MLVGVLAIMLPMASSIGVARFIGWLMIFDGIAQGINAFRSKGIGRLSWKLLVAVLYLVAGIYLLLHPFLAVVALTFALAAFFLIQGVLELTEYFAIRKERKSSWVLINGIISIILGVMGARTTRRNWNADDRCNAFDDGSGTAQAHRRPPQHARPRNASCVIMIKQKSALI